jgi:hypothetical protein
MLNLLTLAAACAALFSARPDRAAVEQTIACYSSTAASAEFAAATPAERTSFRHDQLFALTYAITHYSRRADGAAQRTWTDAGLAIATAEERDAASQGSAPLGAAKYWKASFITFDKALLDGLPIGAEPGATMVFPVHTMTALDEISTLFTEATRLNRTYHGCGALRNLGIMYFARPDFFFPGSSDTARRVLTETYSCDQWFSLNVLYYARALRKTGHLTDAITALTWFIGAADTNPGSFGADRLPETREDQATARSLLTRIRREL